MVTAATTTLVLGGARSGKSAHAEYLAAQHGGQVVYIATAQACDEEMAARIAHHRRARPAHWITVEEPLMLAAAISRYAGAGKTVLVDCLTLWLSNLMFSDERVYPESGMAELPAIVMQQRAALLQVLDKAAGNIILVSNEVGMGIMPLGAVTRCFVDEQGRLNQALAAQCRRAIFVAAGLPLVLKDSQ